MTYRIHLTGAAEQGVWMGFRRLALVCEGGGQRGIFTAGVLDAFLAEGFFPFQLMIGTSAGAQNLSAYACGQLGYARHVIRRYSTRKEFYNPLRFMRGGHLIDLDWFLDTAAREYPLDLERAMLRLAGRELYMCASRSDTLVTDFLRVDRHGWLPSIKASSAVPMFYRGGVTLGGVCYWDGGVSDALPVKAAHERGADLIVVVRTLPVGHTESAPRPVVHLPQGGRLRAAAEVVNRHKAAYREAQAFIESPPAGVRVMELAPLQALRSHALGSSLAAMEQDYATGRACGRQFMARYAWRLCQKEADTRIVSA
ncbi:patatin-like phospholipase family protein [Craterilacuibacter sp.]|uniref:patatin-like phospholipase family protein n=1 Tax=Craterilacuibacter sp. TaxID=2870909 RepID=UPI003F2F023C